jgi:leader peptidase (prepilin peptidase)/N-methyltransferase
LLDFVTACWLGLIGACIGSFLNVVAYRMPRGVSVVWKPSHCPQCGHDIRARDNLPVLGWLLLRGRCRDCGAPISPRYAIVEALMAAAFFVLAYAELFTGGANLSGEPIFPAAGAWDTVWNPHWPLMGLFAFHGALLSLLMAMVLINQDGQRVPWKLIVLAAALVAYASWEWPGFYPERTRSTRVWELKALVDALCGIAWGAMPWIAALAVYRRQGRTAHAAVLFNIAAALGTIGGFLGLHAVVRITLAWLASLLVAKILKGGALNRLGALASLWPLALAHISLWRHIAPLLNW